MVVGFPYPPPPIPQKLENAFCSRVGLETTKVSIYARQTQSTPKADADKLKRKALGRAETEPVGKLREWKACLGNYNGGKARMRGVYGAQSGCGGGNARNITHNCFNCATMC